LLAQQFQELAHPTIRYVQIFENRGATIKPVLIPTARSGRVPASPIFPKSSRLLAAYRQPKVLPSDYYRLNASQENASWFRRHFIAVVP
jgi:hypothetical protein